LAWALLGYDGEEPASDFYLPVEGMPKRSELVAHYEKLSGLSAENLDYYLVLANFKIGLVLEKTYAANVSSGKGDPKVIEAFGPMILQSIAKAADLARSLPSK
jgi:aminoglycoside phosphotransferase (APT) family kinase protein